MSEEMKEALQTNETAEAEKAEPEAAETMADYEEHFDDANPWNRVKEYMDNQTILPVKVEGVVNGGVIVMVEGLRGFVPASKLSLSYIEDLETYLLKDIEVRVIDVDQASIVSCSPHARFSRRKREKRARSRSRTLRSAQFWKVLLRHCRTTAHSYAWKTGCPAWCISPRSARSA